MKKLPKSSRKTNAKPAGAKFGDQMGGTMRDPSEGVEYRAHQTCSKSPVK